MQVTDDNYCFVCGAANNNGLQANFTIDTAQNAASAVLTIDRRFQGWQGVVHGGILATLLDEACVYAVRRCYPQVVTAELAVRYKKPVPVATPLLVRAELAGQRKRILEVRAWIEIAGEVYAEADGKIFIMTRPEQPTI